MTFAYLITRNHRCCSSPRITIRVLSRFLVGTVAICSILSMAYSHYHITLNDQIKRELQLSDRHNLRYSQYKNIDRQDQAASDPQRTIKQYSPVSDSKNDEQHQPLSLLQPSLLMNTTSGITSTFVKYDNVAIVTKIHGPHQWEILEQSICLFHHAYNQNVLYDIIVFSAEPVPQEKVSSLARIIEPAKISIHLDNRGLQEEIAALSPARYQAFLNMCNVTHTADLDWWSRCEANNNNRLNYNWQAEFRSLHLWHHPALATYKTMLWIDTDVFCTEPWKNDPIQYFIENDGVIMFDHFPQGHSKQIIQPKVYEGFNKTLCELKLSDEGNLVAKYGEEGRCHDRGIKNIHGFFHITNLDFYRSETVRKGLAAIFGDCFLCRFPDDQLSVTVPAAMLAPEKSWEMRSKGFHLNVFHNGLYDGIDQAKPAGFLKYWKEKGNKQLPKAYGVCPITAKN